MPTGCWPITNGSPTSSDAVPRLRRFVLDLAVRGKLVEQNPNDEPAAALLKRYCEGEGAASEGGGEQERKVRSPDD